MTPGLAFIFILCALAVIALFFLLLGPKIETHPLVGIKESRRPPTIEGRAFSVMWIDGDRFHIYAGARASLDDVHHALTCPCSLCSAWRARAKLDLDDEMYGLKALERDTHDRFRQEYVGTFPEDDHRLLNEMLADAVEDGDHDRDFLNWWYRQDVTKWHNSNDSGVGRAD